MKLIVSRWSFLSSIISLKILRFILGISYLKFDEFSLFQNEKIYIKMKNWKIWIFWEIREIIIE